MLLLTPKNFLGRGDFDEEGEPIFDPDMASDRELSPDPGEDNNSSQHEEEDEDFTKEPSDASKPKPRKRLIKKTSRENPSSSVSGANNNDEEEGEEKDASGTFIDEDEDEDLNKKIRKEKLLRESLKAKGKLEMTSNKISKLSKNSKKRERPVSPSPKLSRRGDREVKEMWDSVVGNESEVILLWTWCDLY